MYSFFTAYTKSIGLSVETYCPNTDNEGWERKLLQHEPDPIDIFSYEEKIIKLIGQENDPAAPAEVTFVHQVELDVPVMQCLKKMSSYLRLILRRAL